MNDKYKYIKALCHKNKLIVYKILELSNMEYLEYWVFIYSIIKGNLVENTCQKLIIDRNKHNKIKEKALMKFDFVYSLYEKEFIEILNKEIEKKKKHKTELENNDFLLKNNDF